MRQISINFYTVEAEKIKNSPTGIRTPVFHVTGEDTNQLYYWRLLRIGQFIVVEVSRSEEAEGQRGRGHISLRGGR